MRRFMLGLVVFAGMVAAAPISIAYALAEPRFEFEVPPGLKGLTMNNKTNIVLEEAAGTKVTCTGLKGSGKIPVNNTNKVTAMTIVFTGCTESLFGGGCKSAGKAAGEIGTTTLEGQLGYLKAVKSGKVGLYLFPEKGNTIAVFECTGGFAKIELKGGLICEIIKINVAFGKKFEVKCEKGGAAGAQLWTEIRLEAPFESGNYENVKASLEMSLNKGKFAKANLQGEYSLTPEENTKIVA